MTGRMLIFAAALTAWPLLAPAQTPATNAVRPVSIHVEPPHVEGPRALAPQTAQAAIRDYLESWKAMRAALDQNQPGLLNVDFVGTAKDKLAATIQEQKAAGIHARYQDRAHNLQIVFYSPEGLSIELTDTVDYDMQVFDQDKPLSNQQVHARYLVVMTPSEVRWKVRVFQAANP